MKVAHICSICKNELLVKINFSNDPNFVDFIISPCQVCTKDSDDLEEKISELENNIENRENEIDELADEIEELKDVIKDLEDKIEKLEEGISRKPEDE